MKKPKVFIASPLFNGPQIAIIQRIEDLLSGQGFDYYSARLHSGSAGMTPEQRKDPKAWDPVMSSNVDGLNDCSMMIAVISYAFPSTGKYVGTWLCGYSDGIEYGEVFEPQMKVELPDAGTIWEAGYHTAQGKPVIAFHPSKPPQQLNLMISHSVVGVLSGFDSLQRFLQPSPRSVSFQGGETAAVLLGSLTKKVTPDHLERCLPWFDWSEPFHWSNTVE